MLVNTQLIQVTDPVRVSTAGYFYAVDMGPFVAPRHHRVNADLVCTCELGRGCPASTYVAGYLLGGGVSVPRPTPGFFPVVPHACPICGSPVRSDPRMSTPRRGAGWACERDGSHYLAHHTSLIVAQMQGRE